MASQDSTKQQSDKLNAKTGKVIHCLHCNNETFAHLIANYNNFWKDDDNLIWGDDTWNLFLCPVCNQVTLEYISAFSEDLDYEYAFDGEPIVVPRTSILYPYNTFNSLPEPHPDLPEELIEDYEEARSIAKLSPRGAAALLRLILQKLCKHLGASGKNINDDIAYLVSRGLPEKMQKSFDIVRIIGNEAVHPGVIDLKDNLSIVEKLFSLINLIVEYLVTKPTEIENLYSIIPAEKLAAIEKRDQKK